MTEIIQAFEGQGVWLFLSVVAVIFYLRYQDKMERYEAGRSVYLETIGERKVYTYVKEIAVEFEAHRAYITKFYNGGKFVTGRSIRKICMTNEYNRPHSGLEYVANKWQDIFVSGQLVEMLDDLLREKIQVFHSIEDIPYELKRNQMKYDKLKSCYNFLLIDHRHPLPDGIFPPIGIFSIYYKKENALSPEAITAIAFKMSQIQNALISKDKNDYKKLISRLKSIMKIKPNE